MSASKLIQGRQPGPGRRLGAALRGWRRRFLLLLLPVAAAAAGCGSAGEDRPGALVVILVDTLRGDRLGCTGYEAATTPVLDSLAAGGTLFTHAMTPVPVTLPATTSILTGRLPFHHGIRDNGYYRLADREETLAERFRRMGWRTGAVIGAAVLAADRGLDQGFETYDDAFGGPYTVYEPSLRYLAEEFSRTRRRADRVTDLAIDRLREFEGGSFFLLVHYYDVHQYYDPPPPHAARHPGHAYDGEVSFVDEEIGRLLEALRDREDALVLVAADHGEGQNEHGEPGHGFLLYEPTLHVPVIVNGPGVPRGLRRDDPISLVDLEPTLARAFHLPKAEVPRDGRALTWAEPEPRPADLYAETFRTLVTYRWSELRALRRGPLKLIEGGGRVECYDLARDPGETVNLAGTAYAEKLEETLSRMVEGDDPEAVYSAAHHAPDPQAAEVLASLGYLGAGPEEEELPATRSHPADELPAWRDTQWAKEYFRAAIMLVDEGDLDRALVLLDSTLIRNPRLADARYARGTVLERLDRSGEARREFEKTVELDPDHALALAALARMAEDAARPDRAFRYWSEVFRVEPENKGALTFLANWHLKHGKPETALPFLRKLVETEPDDPAVRFNLGLAAYKSGRKEEGRRHLERFLDLAPENAPNREEIQRLMNEE